MGKFKKGVFFGSLLGASMMWMSTTKKGKEFGWDILFTKEYLQRIKTLIKND